MNLVWFLTTIVQYKFSWDKRGSIRQMKKMLDESGSVWQKFAQMLSYQEELIGKDLAVEMQQMLYDCPTHPHEYSRRVIKQSFGGKYDISDMVLCGSGTIAQVYKVGGDKCIKVRHPNVVSEITDACRVYNSVRNAFFMPTALTTICNAYFDSLEIQLDFHNEYNNGITYKQLIHGETDGTNNLFIIPQMLDVSDECIVMEYEPSEPIILSERHKYDKHILLKLYHGMANIAYINQLVGFLHTDLHFGNYGIRNAESPDTMKIVIYDFGLMSDMRNELSPEKRKDFTIYGGITYDFEKFITFFFEPGDVPRMMYMLDENEIGNREHFQINCTKLLQFIAINGLSVPNYVIMCIQTQEKLLGLFSLLNTLERDYEYNYMYKYIRNTNYSAYIDKYFPYDDCQLIKEQFGHLKPPK
jgi:predicted unusual protein kinase regulating ubiquinone biosynthesis (AarF/ABC1/UbiB family)